MYFVFAVFSFLYFYFASILAGTFLTCFVPLKIISYLVGVLQLISDAFRTSFYSVVWVMSIFYVFEQILRLVLRDLL